MATTAACRRATSGCTSGVGLASANTMLFGAIEAISSSGTCPPETPDEHVGALEGDAEPAVQRARVGRGREPALVAGEVLALAAR